MTAVSDVCVVGHITRDVIQGTNPRGQAGGAAFYAATVSARLGLSVQLITRLAAADQDLLTELRGLGVRTTVKDSAETTVFAIDGEGRAEPLSVAGAFVPDDLDSATARSLLMDPLTGFDDFAPLLAKASQVASVVALDLQGFVRKFLVPGVPRAKIAAALLGLAQVTIAKATLAEACALTGKNTPGESAQAIGAMGPREVIVTLGPQGSRLFADGTPYEIPAYPPSRFVSAIGAGDTYLGGYLAARLDGESPDQAARFGAAAASLKIGRAGAFSGSKADVAAVLARHRA